jgi:hypothetical protein
MVVDLFRCVALSVVDTQIPRITLVHRDNRLMMAHHPERVPRGRRCAYCRDLERRSIGRKQTTVGGAARVIVCTKRCIKRVRRHDRVILARRVPPIARPVIRSQVVADASPSDGRHRLGAESVPTPSQSGNRVRVHFFSQSPRSEPGNYPLTPVPRAWTFRIHPRYSHPMGSPASSENGRRGCGAAAIRQSIEQSRCRVMQPKGTDLRHRSEPQQVVATVDA